MVADVIPRDILNRTSKTGKCGGIRAHHVQPKGLGYRRSREVEGRDFNRPPRVSWAEEKGTIPGSRNRHQAQLVLRAGRAPLVGQRLHRAQNISRR